MTDITSLIIYKWGTWQYWKENARVVRFAWSLNNTKKVQNVVMRVLLWVC